jgi:hypothetical protein
MQASTNLSGTQGRRVGRRSRALLVVLVALVVAVAALLFVPAGSDTASAAQQKYYGALWASGSLHHSYPGFATNLSNANGYAYNRCLRAGKNHPAKYKKDCRPGVWVQNGWMAWAQDRNGKWGTGWARKKSRAVYHAKRICRNRGGGSCGARIEAFRTRAYNKNMATVGGRLKTSKARPAAPSKLRVMAVNSSTIRLRWQDNSNNESGFEVNNGVTGRYAGANSTTYNWGGLAPNTYMCFKVRAFNSAGNSPYVPRKHPYYKCATTPGGGGVG